MAFQTSSWSVVRVFGLACSPDFRLDGSAGEPIEFIPIRAVAQLG